MKLIYTNGENEDFINLCQMLDDYLNEIVGGEKQRSQYVRYNKLDDIHDVILIYEDELPIACASFKFYEEGVAELKRVYVHKAYRGRGLSLILMGKLEEKAKEQGFHTLILETGKLLVEAGGLYKKIGYKIIDNYGQYKNMSDSVCMCKML